MEHARHVLGETDATHAEYTHETAPSRDAVITPLACDLTGVDVDITIVAGTKLATLHGAETATEHATCSFGLDPRRQGLAERGGVRIAAVDDTGEVRAVERIDHPFLVATLYQPQLRSWPDRPHPVFIGLIDALDQ